MWELIALDDLSEDDVLICFFSTAAFTPKILFDKEPKIIFLFDLLPEKMFNAKELVSGLSEIYSNSNKVMVPTTIDEAIIMINCSTEKLEQGINV